MLTKRNVLFAGLAVIALAFSVYVWYRDSKKFEPRADLRAFKTAGEFEKYYKNLEEAYKKDTYGGATPEETLQLFIDALKKGDVELAAKYFIPEKQKEEEENLNIGKNNDVLYLLISDLEKKKIGKKLSSNTFRFITVDDTNVVEFQFDLIFNKYTNIWKIENL